MLIKKVFFVSLALLILTGSGIASAQNKVNIVPLDDGLTIPILIEEEPVVPVIPEDPEFLDQFFTKPLIFNKGWDQTVPNRIRIDPTVKIEFIRQEQVFCCRGVIFTPNEIRQWGEQQLFQSPLKIYSAGVLMVEKENTLEGGRFEWTLNQQGFISFHNVVRTDFPANWIRDWTDPRPGDTVHFFIMSDDERFSSNPITFTW